MQKDRYWQVVKIIPRLEEKIINFSSFKFKNNSSLFRAADTRDPSNDGTSFSRRLRDRANSKPAERPVSIHDINRFREREFRRWLRTWPRQSDATITRFREGPLPSHVKRASRARCVWQSQRTSRRRAMRVTRYARATFDRNVSWHRTGRWLSIASRLRQTDFINPHQQPPLALLTSPVDKDLGRPTKRTGFVDILDSGLLGPSSADYIHPKWSSTVFEVVTKDDDYIRNSFLGKVHRR